jgi:hypothetical protein
VADDLTGVPTGELARLRESVQRAAALTLALWAVVIVLALTLARKRLISWPDLAETVGWRG